MIEIIAQAFETPEVAATNSLTLVTFLLVLVTGMDAEAIKRVRRTTRKAALLARVIREDEAPAPLPRKVRNTAGHRF